LERLWGTYLLDVVLFHSLDRWGNTSAAIRLEGLLSAHTEGNGLLLHILCLLNSVRARLPGVISASASYHVNGLDLRCAKRLVGVNWVGLRRLTLHLVFLLSGHGCSRFLENPGGLEVGISLGWEDGDRIGVAA
jgi:hypothetical protein